jgi:hypothetical protein
MLLTGGVQTHASADSLEVPPPQSRQVSGRSASGCSYASGTVTVVWVPLGELNGVPTYLGTNSWDLTVTNTCDDGQSHLRARYTVGYSPTGSYTTPWTVVASSGTLNYHTSVTQLPVGAEFQVCDYSLLEGDRYCGTVD